MSISEFVKSHPAEAVAAATAIFGGGFALYRYLDDLKWRRQKFASELWEKFAAKPNNQKAMIMLDWVRKIEIRNKDNQIQLQKVDQSVLTAALAIPQNPTSADCEKLALSFENPELEVRDIFDSFFTDLAEFDHHIESGLITFDQVRPYLRYWLETLTGNRPCMHPSLPPVTSAFLDAYGYEPVKNLCHRAYLRFPPANAP